MLLRDEKMRDLDRDRDRDSASPKGVGGLVSIVDVDSVEWRANDAGMRRVWEMERLRRMWWVGNMHDTTS